MLKTTAIQDRNFVPEHNKFLPSHFEPRPVLQVSVGDLLITCAGPRARCGISCLVREAAPRRLISGKMYRFRVRLGIAAEFMELFLQSSRARHAINVMKTGSSESGLNLTQERFRRLLVVIPPLAAQQRIVAKVNELMSLCDELQAAQTERESRRGRLRMVSLANLLAADVHTREESARFFLSTSSRVVTKPEHVAGVRQSILDLAVQGRLVASGGGNDWRTAPSRPLRELLDVITDGDHATPRRVERHDAAIPLVTAKNVRDGFMDLSDTDWIERETAEKSWKRCDPSVGDILLVCVGATIGRLCVLRGRTEMVLVRSVALLRPGITVSDDFLALCLRSPTLQAQIWRGVKATGQPCLYLGRIGELTIPLPPLPEQGLIVAKVHELMAVCDGLEKSLATEQTERERLLEALLTEAVP